MKKSSSSPAVFIAPMKALGVEEIRPGDWHCEIKFDGYRAIAVLNNKKVALISRTQKAYDYPEVSAALAQLSCTNATLDGEIVALDANGRTSFQALQGADLDERPPLFYYAFDLLHLNGRSLVAEPLEERRRLLEKLFSRKSRVLKLSPVLDTDPATLLRETRKLGLEGIIMKARGSAYEPDQRSGAWLKVKNINEQEFVIGGFTPPKNSRSHFGSIAVGYYAKGKLLYAGKVGSGFDHELLASLHREFLKRRIPETPFANLPLLRTSRFGEGMTAAAMRAVTWIRPELVAQIKFAEWTKEGILRQPVFLGLRQDKPAKNVRREAPTAQR